MSAGVRGHVYKMRSHEPYPWVFEVDYLRPDGTRNTSIDSFDYGSLATQQEAMLAARELVASYQGAKQ